MPPTPQYRWPALERLVGCELWTKHENHTPVGAFKIRGGLVYFEELVRGGAVPDGVIAATRGNHGQSVAFAAARAGVPATIVVPLGNSREKNAAMISLGARLIEHGADFQESFEYAQSLAQRENLHMVPSFHPDLVRGVATYALEFLRAIPLPDAVYVPVGMGSGICGMIAAAKALNLPTEIVGVCAENAPALAQSLREGRIVEAPADSIADGVACRTPNADVFAFLAEHNTRIVSIGEDEIAEAMRALFVHTHNVAEGAGALALAGVLKDASARKFDRIGIVLSGGNVDADRFARILSS